jgi:hypothetical protein
LDKWIKHLNALPVVHPDRDHTAADVVIEAIKLTAGGAKNQTSYEYTRKIIDYWIQHGYGTKPVYGQKVAGLKYPKFSNFLEQLKAA